MLKIRPESCVTCTIDVMTTLGPRPRNLVGWYEKLGYHKLGEEIEASWHHVMKPEMRGIIKN
jgi:hypothetical protein